MVEIAVRRYGPDAVQAVAELQIRYARVWPGAQVVPAEVYALPVFQKGANILCAYDPERHLVGYAPICPNPSRPEDGPLELWSALRADPDAENRQGIQDALHDALVCRARAISDSLQAPGCRMLAQCQASEVDALDYLVGRGWLDTERVYHMRRDLDQPIQETPAPEGIALRHWPMRTPGERRRYLAAIQRAMPEAGSDEERLAAFLAMAVWTSGTTIAAFSGKDIVGDVMVYADPHESEQLGRPVCTTEDIWVVPEWRRRGIASSMIAMALRYLTERDTAEARLQVSAPNKRALRLYQRLGYEILSESRILKLDL